VVYETTNSVNTSYVLAGSKLISQTQNGVARFYLQDGQGSTRTLTDNSGSVTDTYSYTAFGEMYGKTGTTTNNYLYTSQRFDSLTNLYSLRARFYNPVNGRFLSRDTFAYNLDDPFELNRYVYVANTPINAIDPTGNQIMVEYAQVNRQGKEEEAQFAQVTGRQVEASLDEQQLAFRVIEINRKFPPFTKGFSTFAEGEVVTANGTRQTVMALNRNQWIKMARIYDKSGAVGIQTEQESIAFLRTRGVLSQSDIALTSEDVVGIPFSSGMHAEEIIMRWAVQNGARPISIVASNSPCVAICQALTRELAAKYGWTIRLGWIGSP
jgi:RHS repeat-associated protein